MHTEQDTCVRGPASPSSEGREERVSLGERLSAMQTHVLLLISLPRRNHWRCTHGDICIWLPTSNSPFGKQIYLNSPGSWQTTVISCTVRCGSSPGCPWEYQFHSAFLKPRSICFIWPRDRELDLSSRNIVQKVMMAQGMQTDRSAPQVFK